MHQETPTLTEQDLAVVRLVAEGKSNKEIALEIERGVGTVKDHVAAACRKLGVTGRVALARWYWENHEKQA